MLIGHQPIIDRLMALAKDGRLGHGYLFFGPPRVGKRTAAITLARMLEGLPGDDEKSVLRDAAVTAPGENGEIGIDAARGLKGFLALEPVASPYRMAIVDNADALSPEAQNALLKITEEPPAHGLLVLTVPDPEHLLPALRSRLQAVRFGTAPAADIAAWLTAMKVPAARAKELAKASGGAPGLAWALEHDEAFRTRCEAADRFLAASGAARAKLVKELVAEDESFDLRKFLDALLVAAHRRGNRDPKLWHGALQLRRLADSYNLNPRLQLTALGDALTHA